MENLVTESDTPSTPKQEKKKSGRLSKLKNILFYFFVVEHIVIILLLSIPAFFFVRALASSEFGQLDTEAKHFTPAQKDTVIEKYTERYKGYVMDFVTNPDDIPSYSFEIEEEDINSFIYDLKLSGVKSVYIQLGENNTFYIWGLPEDIPYALMFKGGFEYDFKSENAVIDITSWQLGPLSMPASWLGFVETSLNEDLFQQINSMGYQYGFVVTDIRIGKKILEIDILVEDKEKMINQVLSGQ